MEKQPSSYGVPQTSTLYPNSTSQMLRDHTQCQKNIDGLQAQVEKLEKEIKEWKIKEEAWQKKYDDQMDCFK